MPTQLLIRSRAIILLDNKLLVFYHSSEATWAGLPGGKHELGETIQECMEREMLEETGIPAQVGKLLFIHELFESKKERYSLEFFFYIENSQDYKNIDFSKATHGSEVDRSMWLELSDVSVTVLPQFLQSELQEVLRVGIDNWQTKSVISRV